MTDFTDYTETAIRAWMSQGSDMPTAPGTVYVALHTSDPGDSPDGSTEVGTSSYERIGVTAGSGFNTSTSGGASVFSNANAVTYPEATEDWGTVSHVSLWDSKTGGNCLAAYALDSSKTISTNDIAEFAIGDLSFEID